MAIRRFVNRNPSNFTIEVSGFALDFYSKVIGIIYHEPSNSHGITYTYLLHSQLKLLKSMTKVFLPALAGMKYLV